MSDITFLQETSNKALNRPKVDIWQADFPFTLNTHIGCLFGCSYCYLQTPPFAFLTEFGKEVRIKTDLPQKLDRELFNYSHLPSFLKRVQINEATEGYLPQVVKATQDHLGRDIMREVLDTFRRHWKMGNRWMLHLVTKSHLILKHIDLLEEMRDQVQVELTITTLDETVARKVEGVAPSVGKRLEIIDRLSERGLFVRIMCMPFLGDKNEAATIKETLLQRGAKAFKQKGLNYYDREKLLKGKVDRVKGRKDEKFQDLIFRSGEPVKTEDGTPQTVYLPLPDKALKVFTRGEIAVRDSGYALINQYDWGNIL